MSTSGGATIAAAHGWAVDNIVPGLSLGTDRRLRRVEVSLSRGVLRRGFAVMDYPLDDAEEREGVVELVRAELDHYRAFFDAVGPVAGWDGAWDRDGSTGGA